MMSAQSARSSPFATGFAYGGSGLASKWLELLKEISPEIARVAVLFNPDAAHGGGAYYLHPFEAAAPSFAITPIAAPVRSPDEIARVILGLEGQPPSGLIVAADYFVSNQRELIINTPLVAAVLGETRSIPRCFRPRIGPSGEWLRPKLREARRQRLLLVTGSRRSIPGVRSAAA
jgi:hypothetical protein